MAVPAAIVEKEISCFHNTVCAVQVKLQRTTENILTGNITQQNHLFTGHDRKCGQNHLDHFTYISEVIM